MGAVEERALGASLARTAGEEIAQSATTCQLPALPHHGDQPQVACELAASRAHLCGRTSSRHPSQPASYVQYGMYLLLI